MVGVGIVFVLNSLDSLIRLYSDNLNLTVSRLGKLRYIILHSLLMISLTVLFSLQFIRIQWVEALVIGIGFSCLIYLLIARRWQKLPNAAPLFGIKSKG